MSIKKAELFDQQFENSFFRSPELQRLFFDNLPFMVYLLDTEGNYLYGNPQMLRLAGVTLKELRKKHFSEFLAGDDSPEMFKAVVALMQGKEVHGLRTKCKDDKGEVYEFLINAIPIKENNDIVGVLNFAQDITQQAWVEAELRKSEERYRYFFNANPDLIYLCTPEGKILDTNLAMQRRFNLPPEAFRDKQEADFFEAPTGPEDDQAAGDLMNGKVVHGLERSIHSQFGINEVYELNCIPILEEGRLKHILNIARDLTERKRIEKALVESEKQYRRLADNMMDMVSMVQAGGHAIYLSPSHQTILGYNPQDLVGGHILDLVHPDDLAAVAETYARGLNEFIPGKAEHRIRHADGHYIWIESTGKIITDEKGEYIGAIFNSRDITERKLAEFALRESEEHFRTIINEVNDIIYIHDFDGNFMLGNQAAYDFLGYTPEDSDLTVDKIVPQAALVKVKAQLDEFRKGIKPPPLYELEVIKKDGSVATIEVHTSIYFHKGVPRGVLGVARDITARKKAEELKRYQELFKNVRDLILVVDADGGILEVNEQAGRLLGLDRECLLKSKLEQLIDREEASRLLNALFKDKGNEKTTLETKISGVAGHAFFAEIDAHIISFLGRPAMLCVARDVSQLKKIARELERRNQELESILYAASHDLKTPVVTIEGYADLLLEMFADVLPEEAKKFISRINNAGMTLGNLIADLVKITRYERESVALEEVDFSSLLDKVWESLAVQNQNAKAGFKRASDFPKVFADPGRLEQVLSNLLGNALKFSRPSEPQIEVGWQLEEGEFIFYIQDNGIGIEKDHHRKIFEPFFRVQDVECEGNGIGLALTQMIVEKHGGRIWVESTKGEGSTFYFSLPVRRS